MDKIGIVLLAAGNGLRFGEQKQCVNFMGKPLWEHAYETAKSLAPSKHIAVVGIHFPGGKTRTQSVHIGLKRLEPSTSKVIIMEAARPLVTHEQLNILASDTHQSVSFVAPLVNTVVMRNGNYLNRDELYELLTPQAFDYKMLLNALNSGKYIDYTDETRVMYEEYGIKAKFIQTSDNLFKITYKKDLALAEYVYKELNYQLLGECYE